MLHRKRRLAAIGDSEARSVDWHDYISVDPNIIFGKPAVKGTRMGVEFLLELFAAGWDEDLVLRNYSHLTPESLRAVFAHGADIISEVMSEVEPVSAR